MLNLLQVIIAVECYVRIHTTAPRASEREGMTLYLKLAKGVKETEEDNVCVTNCGSRWKGVQAMQL